MHTYIPISPDRSSKSYQVYTMYTLSTAHTFLTYPNPHKGFFSPPADVTGLSYPLISAAVHVSRQKPPTTEYRLRHHYACSPSASLHSQKPTCEYNFRPCPYCFCWTWSG